MASGKTSGFGDWDKGETDFHDVGLGLRLHQQPPHVFSRSGEGLTRIAFTASQRQELERQTMIYKYMKASMPVPPELLIPLTKYPPMTLPQLLQNDQSSTRKAFDSRFYGRSSGGPGGDLEPWRCRRTDGKKWRCSRDVAPDQKYCERHSHKGRPSARSRKPVESSLHVSHHPTTITSSSTTTNRTSNNPIAINPLQQHPSSSFDSLPSSLNQYHHQSTRYPEWFMKDEITPAAHSLYPQQMEQLAGETRGNTSHFSQHRSSSGETTQFLSRPFIDAWSLEDVHKVGNSDPTSTANNISNISLPTEVTGNNKCPSSSISSILPLTLSMSAVLGDPDTTGGYHKGDGHDIREIRSGSHQQQSMNWMTSWINLPPGGPLAEALCLGMSGTTNAWTTHSDELVSPHGHSSSSSSTTMSSKGSHASADTNCQGFQLQ